MEEYKELQSAAPTIDSFQIQAWFSPPPKKILAKPLDQLTPSAIVDNESRGIQSFCFPTLAFMITAISRLSS